MPSDLDHLEIGTISFARCEGEKMLRPSERVRLILAAAEAYDPDLLVTAGHAIYSMKQLERLAREYRNLGGTGAIVTEVLDDGDEAVEGRTHAMYAVTCDGGIRRFGRQLFARSSELADPAAGRLAAFVEQLPQRTIALGEWNVFALVCGELNIIQGRETPAYRSVNAEEAIIAADVVINPTHDRMGNAGTLDAKRRLLSRASDDGRNRIYVSVSNWEACGNDKGRIQYPSPTLHTVYASGEPQPYREVADGAFGFVYRQWSLEL